MPIIQKLLVIAVFIWVSAIVLTIGFGHEAEFVARRFSIIMAGFGLAGVFLFGAFKELFGLWSQKARLYSGCIAVAGIASFCVVIGVFSFFTLTIILPFIGVGFLLYPAHNAYPGMIPDSGIPNMFLSLWLALVGLVNVLWWLSSADFLWAILVPLALFSLAFLFAPRFPYELEEPVCDLPSTKKVDVSGH